MASVTMLRGVVRRLSLAAVSLAILLLGACSQAPSDQEIEALLQERYARGALIAKQYFDHRDDNPFIISDIKKTNGVKKGDNEYIAYVKYNYVATMSFSAWWKKVSAEGRDPNSVLRTDIPGDIYSQVRDHQFQMYQTFPHQEELTLVKTERGWRLKGLFMNE